MPRISGDFIELKSNPDLLNPKFSNYKISFDKYLQRQLRLCCTAVYREAGNSQFGFEHLKLFNDINYLYSDPYSLSGRSNRFYVFLDDNCLHSFTFDGNNFQTAVIEANIRCSLDECKDVSERYPPTLTFTDEDFIFISNGCGVLSMFSTGQRNSSVIWKEVMSSEIQFSERKIGPFIIIESRRFNGNRIEVLVRSIISHEKSREETAGHMFWNRLHWISISNDEGQWQIERVREIICKGHLEFATIDPCGNDIILAGTEDYYFSPSDKNEVMDAPQSSRDMKQEICDNEKVVCCEKNDTMYIWTQTLEDVTVYFKLAENIEKSGINLLMSSSTIHFSYKGRDLLHGKFGGLVDSSSSTYVLDGNKLELTLFKASSCNWTSVVVGDERGLQECSREAMDSAYSHLEAIKSDVLGLESSSGNRSFNTDLLEECDMSGEELSKVLWVSGENYAVKHTADISGNVVLFTCQLSNEPRMFCIRMDVDGVLWSFSSVEQQPVVHTATFNAFGYVEASKSEKKFVTCSSDFKYAAIVETTRRAYLYWQLLPISDIEPAASMNMSKQCLIALQHENPDFDGDSEFDTNNIIGVYAGQYAFYLLTTGHLFAFVFNYDERL